MPFLLSHCLQNVRDAGQRTIGGPLTPGSRIPVGIRGISYRLKGKTMTDDDCAKARTVHALLSSAFPHRTDENLKKAADLLVKDGDFQEQKAALLAIQTAMAAIEEGASAAEGERLLIEATRQAASWVQRCSKDARS